MEQLSPFAATTEAKAPRVPGKQGNPLQWEASALHLESSPYKLQLEKAWVYQWRPSIAPNKQINKNQDKKNKKQKTDLQPLPKEKEAGAAGTGLELTAAPVSSRLGASEAIAQEEARVVVGVEDSHVNCSASPDLELLKLWEGVLQVGWVAISPPHHTPRPRPQDWGLPRLGTHSSQAQSSWPGSGSSLASGSLHTQDEVGGWWSSQTRVLSLPRL